MKLTIELTEGQANAWEKAYTWRASWQPTNACDQVAAIVSRAIFEGRPQPIKVWDKVLFARRHPRIVHGFGLDRHGRRWMAVSDEYGDSVYVVYPHADYTMANGSEIQWPA